MTWISTLALMLNLFAPAALRRWGPLGHRIVAQIALDRLTPAVADETRRLLDGRNITDIASWPDEHRKELPQDAPWHYVDIELADSSYVPARDCRQDQCIVAVLDREMRTLGDRTQPDSVRAMALIWVVHLVGDISQPLHGADRNDRGGNDVKVTFQGQPVDLHWLWDSKLLESYGESEAQIESRIQDMIAHTPDVGALAEGTPASWAMESHDLARNVVYRDLPADLVIDQHYADLARPIIYQQLMRGGVRLAAVLDHALAP